MSEDQIQEQNYDIQEEYEEEWPEYDLQSRNQNEKEYSVYDLEQLSPIIYRENEQLCILSSLPPSWNLMLYSFCDFSSEQFNNVIDQNQTGRLMIRFDEAYRPQSSLGECLICCSENQLISNPCKHAFCLNCWAGHIKNSHCNRSQYELFPMCPWQDCVYRTNMLLMKTVWEEQPSLRSHFERLLCLKYAQLSRRVKLCKEEGCNKAIYRNFRSSIHLRCNCGNVVCSICGQATHYPLGCNDMKIWNKILSQNQDHWMSDLVTQKCPMCKTLIEKNGGCIHMRCRCKHQFCWICLKVWKGHTSYSSCNSIQINFHQDRLQEEQIKRKLNQQQYMSRFEETKSEIDRARTVIRRVRPLAFQTLSKQLNNYYILTKDTAHLRDFRDCIVDATQTYIKCQIYIFFQLQWFSRLEAMTKVMGSQINLLDDYLSQKMLVIDRTMNILNQKEEMINVVDRWAIQQIQKGFFEGKEHHIEILNSTRKINDSIKAGGFIPNYHPVFFK